MRQTTRFLATIIATALVLPMTASAQPQPPVALGQASGFTVLAASLISSVPTSEIIGNVGLSPATGSEITGLTQGEVDGFMYTVDASGPAGSVIAAELLTAAKGDLTIAYNDAASRTPVPVGDFLNPGVGNIGGMTLVPGLYRFTSTASITGSDVTLSGNATDVWIFQIESDLVVANGIQVILAGGALADNIFWQVGTSATLGTNCVFKGTILADQSISLNTGATVEGRLQASIGAVTLDASIVTTPGTLSSIDESYVAIPQMFTLHQNYPNPFNPSTQISFDLAIQSHVSIAVFDILGQEVATLVDREMEVGNHHTTWDASQHPSGIYFVRMSADNFTASRKLALLK
ncbi:DUF3494 domain-containing protein [bacterium]|nr:DUF3494 domain-containing protein [bacterium]